MSGDIKEAIPDAKKPNPLLPVLGVFLGGSLAVAAYFGAPLLIDILSENIGSFDESTKEIEDDMLHYAFAVLIWFISFSILMTVVASVAARPTVIEQEQRTLHPRKDKLTQREAKKYESKIQKQRKKKIAALKKLKEKQAREEKRGG